jgi:hypothetical protein
MADLGGKAQLGHSGGHILMDARRAVELYVIIVASMEGMTRSIC